MQLDNDTDRFWFQEELVVANIVGIGLENCTCYHVKNQHFIWIFFCGISMIFDVMFGPNAMKWHDQLRCFFSVFWDAWRPTIRMGAPSHDDVWTRGHTQASRQD